MAKRNFLAALAAAAAATAVLGGLPAPAALAAGPAAAVSANADPALAAPVGGPALGALPPALAARLSEHVDRPVIVVMKDQFGQAAPGTAAAAARSAAVLGSQSALLKELGEVHATGVRRFTLVNSVAATVSAAEAQRLATAAPVAQVIADATVSIPASALGLAPAPPALGTRPPRPTAARRSSTPTRSPARAPTCTTSTASASRATPTAAT